MDRLRSDRAACYPASPMSGRMTVTFENDDLAYGLDETTGRSWPAALLFLLAALAGAAVVSYGVLVDRGAAQIPIIVSGLTVSGLSLVVLGFVGAAAALGNGRAGRVGRALVWALFGGVCLVGAAGCLGGAIVLALVWTSS